MKKHLKTFATIFLAGILSCSTHKTSNEFQKEQNTNESIKLSELNPKAIQFKYDSLIIYKSGIIDTASVAVEEEGYKFLLIRFKDAINHNDTLKSIAISNIKCNELIMKCLQKDTFQSADSLYSAYVSSITKLVGIRSANIIIGNKTYLAFSLSNSRDSVPFSDTYAGIFEISKDGNIKKLFSIVSINEVSDTHDSTWIDGICDLDKDGFHDIVISTTKFIGERTAVAYLHESGIKEIIKLKDITNSENGQ